MFDGVYIKSGIAYNNNMGVSEGFETFEENIIISNEDKVATEAMWSSMVLSVYEALEVSNRIYPL